MHNPQTLNHVIHGLLASGGISAKSNPELFSTMLEKERETKAFLDVMAMDLVVNTATGIAIARNKALEDLEIAAEEENSLPSRHVVSRQRLGHWQSVALIILKTRLDRETRGDGTEDWLTDQEILEAIKVYVPKEHLEDEAIVVKRIQGILETFANTQTRPLVLRRKSGDSSLWRGSPWLDVSVSVDAVRDYERRLLLLVTEACADAGEEIPEAVHEALARLGN
jgi:hypothetical protein